MSPAFVGDLTALFLRADRREYSVEQLHGAILQVCDQHELAPIDCAGIALALGEIKADLMSLRTIPEYTLMVISEPRRNAIAARLTVAIHEMQEFA